MDDLIYRWPDGTWCEREDLTDYLTFMSDDYESMEAIEFYELYPQEVAE